MAGSFISYRERDSKGWALSLRDHLVEAFGEEKDKVNSLSRPILLRRVDLDALDPQIAQLLRPLVQ